MYHIIHPAVFSKEFFKSVFKAFFLLPGCIIILRQNIEFIIFNSPKYSFIFSIGIMSESAFFLNSGGLMI